MRAAILAVVTALVAGSAVAQTANLAHHPANGFEQVVVPEINAGQLVTVLRSEYLVPAEKLSKVNGKPFKISEIEDALNDPVKTKDGAKRGDLMKSHGAILRDAEAAEAKWMDASLALEEAEATPSD